MAGRIALTLLAFWSSGVGPPDLAPRSSLFLARSDEQYFWTSSTCCGIVAAYMICSDFGVPVDLERLSKGLPVSAKGTSMRSLAEYFDGQNFGTIGLELTADELYELLRRRSHVRAVAMVRSNHWVTVFAAGDGKISVFDYPTWQLVPGAPGGGSALGATAL